MHHLARTMNDEKARHILQKVVPKWDKGEVELAQIAVEYPHLLMTLSAGFREAVDNKAIGDELSQRTQKSPFDGKALLQVSEALFDLEITLVTPPGQEWNPSQPIPIFYVPIDDEASVITGVDPDLNPITTLSADSEEAPYPFLALNFNEDSPLLHWRTEGLTSMHKTRSQGFGLWHEILNFFNPVSPAYAHVPLGHDQCFHSNLVQPVEEITIYNDHEPGWWNKPEIMLTVAWTDRNVGNDEFNLKKVDKTNKKYTRYADKRTRHGTCGYRLDFRVWEDDAFYDDEVALWRDVYVGTYRILTPSDVTLRTHCQRERVPVAGLMA